jgi:hypothetical protein
MWAVVVLTEEYIVLHGKRDGQDREELMSAVDNLLFLEILYSRLAVGPVVGLDIETLEAVVLDNDQVAAVGCVRIADAQNNYRRLGSGSGRKGRLEVCLCHRVLINIPITLISSSYNS